MSPAAGDYDPLRGPVRGPEYPTIRPPADAEDGAEPRRRASRTDHHRAAGLRRALRQPRAGANLYGSRRPIVVVVVAIGMVVLLVPVLRLLFSADFRRRRRRPATIVPAVLLTLGFALTGVGLFAVGGGRRAHP